MIVFFTGWVLSKAMHQLWFLGIRNNARNKIFYISIISFFVIINLIFYQTVSSYEGYQKERIVASYKGSIAKTLNRKKLESLEFIVGQQTIGKDFLGQNIVYINTIKNLLDRILPDYLDYVIFLEKNIAGFSKNLGHRAIENQEWKNADSIEAGEIEIKLIWNDDVYKHTFNGSVSKYYYLIIFSAVLIIFFIILALLYRNHSMFIKNKALYSLSKLKFFKRENAKLMNSIMLHQKLNSNFMKVASTTQTKNMPIKSGHYKDIKYGDYVFPIMLVDQTKSEISAEKFSEDLMSYFDCIRFSRLLQVKVLEANSICIPCYTEVFYQIIFSLIINVFRLLENQSDKSRSIKIHISKEKLTLCYSGFPLNENSMVNILEKFEAADLFSLTITKIFESIKYHEMYYTINYVNGHNKIEIIFSKQKEDQKMADIIKFRGAT